MDDLIELRLKCARAIGRQVKLVDGEVKFDVYYGKFWQPDLEGHEAQLVELIEWLASKGCDVRIWPYDVTHRIWKLAIMRAVAEIGGESE